MFFFSLTDNHLQVASILLLSRDVLMTVFENFDLEHLNVVSLVSALVLLFIIMIIFTIIIIIEVAIFSV